MKFVLMLACLLAVAAAYHLESEWAQWKAKHNKSYTAEQEHFRRTIFNKNLRHIHLHNLKFKAGRVSYKLGANKFADLTTEEFDAHHKGLKAAGQARAASKIPFKFDPTMTFPAEVDWRTKGVVTPVKDQGNCSSSWAFSATGSLEGVLAIKTGNLVSLSEQNLIDCDTSDNGCDGGLVTNAYFWVNPDKGGLDSESSYPYTGVKGNCHPNKSGEILSYVEGYTTDSSGSENFMALVVAKNGPISIGFDAEKNFQLYESGIFTDDECSTNSSNHAMLVVGYGTTSNQDYWIVKNSWGTSWGEEGYARVARNAGNVCGIATNWVSPFI